MGTYKTETTQASNPAQKIINFLKTQQETQSKTPSPSQEQPLNEPNQELQISTDPAPKPETLVAAFGSFGLQDETQVAAFLKTPTGKAVETELLKQIEIEEKLIQQASFEQQEEERRMQRIMIALALWALSKTAYAKEKMDEVIRYVQEKIEELRLKLTVTPNSTSKEALETKIASYSEALWQAEGAQHALEEQKELLRAEEEQLDLEAQALQARHALFEQYMDFGALSEEHLSPDELTEDQLSAGIELNKTEIEVTSAQLEAAFTHAETFLRDRTTAERSELTRDGLKASEEMEHGPHRSLDDLLTQLDSSALR